MAVALQLNPLSPRLETGLAQRLEVVRWFDLGEAERGAWLKDRGAEAVAIVAGGHVKGPTELMQALPQLKIIAINGVGYDNVDLALAKSRGVRVTTTPGTLTDDVADLAVGLVISLLRRIPAADAHVRSGAWPSGEQPLAHKVTGRRFGILGLGHIGGAIAKRLAAFARWPTAPEAASPQTSPSTRTPGPLRRLPTSWSSPVPPTPRPVTWSMAWCWMRLAPTAGWSTSRADRWWTRRP